MKDKEQDQEADKFKLSGAQKSAIILLSLSQENSSKVFSALQEDEIKEISQAMSMLGQVENEVIEKVVSEFQREVTSRQTLNGNLFTTEKLLDAVFPKEKVAYILEDLKGPTGRNTWDKLSNVNEDLLAAYLKNEHPQTVALIISKINPATASKVLSILPEELTYDVILRMLNLDSVKKEILEKIENTLRSDFISSISKVQKRDSHEQVAEIFNKFDRTTENKFMHILEEREPDHAVKVKSLMFTFDNLNRLRKQDVALALAKIDKAKLPLALKGASQEIKTLFLESMSQRASKMLLEDMEALGPVKLKDVDEAQSSIIIIVKKMIDDGEITITIDDEEYIE